MYTPKHFEQHDLSALHELIHVYPLATLVTFGDEGLEANHVPLHLSKEPAPYGLLSGHLPRANPLARCSAGAIDAIAIFHGPDAYISPSWYVSKQDGGKVVPTWNYSAVHARGRIRFIDDRNWLHTHLDKFTSQLESQQSQPWSIADAPADFIEKLLPHLIGIEIVIEQLEGKWKASQNRSATDRNGVIAALEKIGNSNATAMADLIRTSNVE